MATVNKGNQEV